MGLSFLKQLQILILSTHTSPCQAQSLLKKPLEKNADYKKKHPSDTTAFSLAGLSHPQTGPRVRRAWTTMVMPLLTNQLGRCRLPHTPDREKSCQPQEPLQTFLHHAGKIKSCELPSALKEFFQASPNTTVFPAECREVMKMQNQRLI